MGRFTNNVDCHLFNQLWLYQTHVGIVKCIIDSMFHLAVVLSYSRDYYGCVDFASKMIGIMGRQKQNAGIIGANSRNICLISYNSFA